MKCRRLFPLIVTLLIPLASNCSNPSEDDGSDSYDEASGEEEGEQNVLKEYIKTPLDKAKAVDKLSGDRNKRLLDEINRD